MAGSRAKSARPRYVLIIEDNLHHAEILTEVLDRHFAPIVIHTVDTVKDGLEFAGQSHYDLILTGAVIRETPVTDAISRIARLAEGTPIIVISGRGDERLAAELIKKGATEYLVKTRETLDNLPTLLARHFKSKGAGRGGPGLRKGRAASPERLPSAAAIVREVDKLTQQALAMVGTKRRKRASAIQNRDQLDQLLNQIRRLREMASKLETKE
ncbi:MAG: response regulator [bacterium]